MAEAPVISNRIKPADALRLYVWELLQAHGLLERITVPGGTVLPIIPIEDEPKLANSGKTYIIYGYGENTGGTLNEIKNGAFGLRIVSDSTTEIGEITTTISQSLDKEDRSAANINAWISQYMNGALKGIKFTWLNVSYISSPEPPDTEGGKGYGIMSVSYRVITHQKAKVYDLASGQWVWGED